MSVDEVVRATRSSVGLFRVDALALIEVKGEDRVRWLDGMISGDVSRLEEQGQGAGCYATLLTNRGKIVSDLHVAHLGEGFLLACQRDQAETVRTTLDRFIIADDVELADVSESFEALALEGPKAPDLLAEALGLSGERKDALVSETRDATERSGVTEERWFEAECAGVSTRIGAFGSSGEPAFQIFVPRAEADAVAAELQGKGAALGLVLGDLEALEILRVEAGQPVMGRELSDRVLPPEARLERAIATDKGCYVGQEIVARLRARGQVNHLLVGLKFGSGLEAASLPTFDTELRVSDRRTGEVKSTVRSPTEGPIALAYVRREHAAPGTEVQFDGGTAQVTSLPFRPLGAEPGGAPTGSVEGKAVS